MKIIFFGTPPFVIPILETMIKHFDVIAIITAPDKKAGRKQYITPSPIKKYLLDKVSSIQIMTPYRMDNDIVKELRALQPDLFVVAAYGKILSKEVLNIPPFGAINIHPSILPRYRGSTPVPQTLLNGDTVTGVTFIKMDEQMDHGPILKITSYEAHPTDTSETLLKHLFTLSAENIVDVIINYTNGKIPLEPQNETEATYTKMLTKEDGFIDLRNPPSRVDLDRMTRAYYPWPTVWSKIKINDKEKIIKFLPNQMIQMEGKKPVNEKDFLNGHPQMKEILKELMKT